MKALGKCLICRGKVAREDIPPERTKICLSLKDTFITYLSGSGQELTANSQLLSHRLFYGVFPFCKQCRKIVATLHRNHFKIQAGLRSIQKVIGKTLELRSFCNRSKNKIKSCTKFKDTTTELSELPVQKSVVRESGRCSRAHYLTDFNSKDATTDLAQPAGDTSEVSYADLEEAPSACNSNVKLSNGVEFLGSDSSQSSNHARDSDYAVERSDCLDYQRVTAEQPSDSHNEGDSKPSTLSSDNRMSFVKKRQQNRLLLKPGVTAVSISNALMRTGPETFVYLGEFGVERTQDGYRCGTCGYVHRIRGEVLYHIRMVHAPPLPHRRNIRLTEKSPNMWYYAEFAAEKVGDEYRCLSCSHVSKLRKKLIAHLRYQHYVSAHPEEAAPNSFVCEVCGKILTSGFRLKMHQESHEDKPNYTCKDCGDVFNTWCKLALHRRKHLGEEGKKFVCEHCGRKFWVQTDLKNHLFRHTGNREFVCKICGKSYATNVGLGVHLDSHTGKQYFCDLCDMEFTQPYSVTRHKRTAHRVHVAPTTERKKRTNEKP